MIPKDIIDEIDAQRKSNAEEWGGLEHDEHHTENDWVALICKHAGKATFTAADEDDTFYNQMISVIALALDAIEAKCPDQWLLGDDGYIMQWIRMATEEEEKGLNV